MVHQLVQSYIEDSTILKFLQGPIFGQRVLDVTKELCIVSLGEAGAFNQALDVESAWSLLTFALSSEYNSGVVSSYMLVLCQTGLVAW